MKARALKEVWNIAAVIPVDRGARVSKNHGKRSGYSEELLPEENFLGICNQELLARGSELLKRTRNGIYPTLLLNIMFSLIYHMKL